MSESRAQQFSLLVFGLIAVACHGGELNGAVKFCRDAAECPPQPACGQRQGQALDCDNEFDADLMMKDGGSDAAPPNAWDGSQSSQPNGERDADRSNSSDASLTTDAGDMRARDGGGDSSSPSFVAASCEDEPPSDTSSPTGPSVDLAFPPRHSYTDSDWLTVRGSASDPDGVSAVYVNGMPANSNDGYASWTARVPVADGCTRLRVASTDRLGNRNENSASASVRNQGLPLSTISALELDARHERLITVSWRVDAILSVGLRDGRVRVLSPREDQQGSFLGSEALAVDAARNRLIIAPRNSDMLLELDLETGERRMLVQPDLAPELSIQFASALALDSEGTTAYVLRQNATSAIVGVDLSTGTRRIVMADAADALDVLYDAVTDPAAPRLLVSQPEAGLILALDLRTGARSTWAGLQQTLVHPGRMRLDSAVRRLLVVDGKSAPAAISDDRTIRNELVAIDLDTGARTRVAGPGTGSEPLLSQAFALAFDERTRRAYIAGETDGQITRIDVASGERSMLVHSNVGAGKRFLLPDSPVLSRGQLWLVDQARNALVRVDLSSGERSDGSSDQKGSGPPLSSPSALVLEGTGDKPSRGLVLGELDTSLTAVDLSTGNRSAIALHASSSGAANSPGLALDTANGRVLFTDASLPPNRSLLALDLPSGQRSVISGAERGTGPALPGGGGVLLDTTRALVLANDSIIAVDLASGNRSYASPPGMVVGGSMIQGAIDLQHQRLLVADAFGGLIGVDLSTGQRAVSVAYDDPGKGPVFRARHVAVDFARQVAYVVEIEHSAIMAVDLASGERTIVSR